MLPALSTRRAADDRPAKRRKQRMHLNCEECRRLKLKCDRQVPCSNCVRRMCSNICPHGSRPKGGSAALESLRDRLATVESLLSSVQDHSRSSEQDNSMLPPEQLDSGPSSLNQTVSPTLTPVLYDTEEPSSVYSASQLSIAPPSTSNTLSLPGSSQSLWEGTSATPFHHPNVRSLPLPSDLRAQTSISSQEELSSETLGSGTLVLSRSGASKWLGPTAGSEWLRDQETSGLARKEIDTPPVSQRPSPKEIPKQLEDEAGHFPFQKDVPHSKTQDILSRLPLEEDARVLIDSYYRYFAWNYNIAPRNVLQPIIDRLYRQLSLHGFTMPAEVSHQQLALVFAILAMGSLHNLEVAPNDSCAVEYLALSKLCLTKGNFMTHNTLAGVQTIHIMGHIQLETEHGRGGDAVWPLWGMAMRFSHAMGLHRDGARWNLPIEVVEERRLVFWQTYAADVFQANCFSRPSSIDPRYIDAAFPREPVGVRYSNDVDNRGFFTLKYELSKISARILDFAMVVEKGSYTTVSDLHQTIIDFERNIPFQLRCRAAMACIPSSWPDPEVVVRDSLEVSTKNLKQTFQQYTLAINISEALLFLHRPFFAAAMYEQSGDLAPSTRGQSYLAVIERCNVIIQASASLFSLFPAVVARHWFFWYHTFNAAVCVGTLVLRHPASRFAAFGLSQIDQAISLFASCAQIRTSQRTLQNLQWLLCVRKRAHKRMSNQPSDMQGADSDPYAFFQLEGEEDAELLGWHTRLIQRMAEGAQTARTIPPSPPTRINQNSVADPGITRTINGLLQEVFQPEPPTYIDGPPTAETEDSVDTNALLHDFWDPMTTTQDRYAGTDFGLSTGDWWNLGQFS
ncbi:fungal-specific transcription factor domain-domain-containing protein [Naematelia encephala]|uniref:Fungal-specific transcription factor domain-domain-containing protein n=1 Tax=Naematelia encephala TaxID=71784 RepID=A0A1Y2B5R9_9TREE|nr:fungal-specific transcription factor domain-domain-containing protein [Naematelia encephala]